MALALLFTGIAAYNWYCLLSSGQGFWSITVLLTVLVVYRWKEALW